LSCIHHDAGVVAETGTKVEEADIATAENLGQHRNEPAVRAVGAVSEVADQAPSIALCGALLILGIIAERPKLAEAGGRMLASVLLATAIKSATKRMITRTRPNVVLDRGEYDFGMESSERGDHQSFPSGHTADAVAAARGLARVSPGASGAAYAAAVVIAAVQVPRAKHYPLDLLAGAAVGIISEALVHRVAARLKDKSAWF
jgi:membrane-associated phospholipid phosphatase